MTSKVDSVRKALFHDNNNHETSLFDNHKSSKNTAPRIGTLLIVILVGAILLKYSYVLSKYIRNR